MNTVYEKVRSAEEVNFWHEVERRRNHFFWVAFTWPFVGIALALLYGKALPEKLEFLAMYLALGTWFAFWVWVLRRLTNMNCFNCRKQAFKHAYFFMRHAKCANCGAAYER